MLQELSDALSIRFSQSEDGSQFQLPFSPQKDKNKKRVKCFRCFGTHEINCQQCHGTQMISYNHPLARLLDDILMRKIGATEGYDERDDQLQQIDPIFQEQEDSQQKRIIYCKCEQLYIQSSSIAKCQKCFLKPTPKSSIVEKSIKNISDDHEKVCGNCNIKIQQCYQICKTCRQIQIDYLICHECSDLRNYDHSSQHIFETAINGLCKIKNSQMQFSIFQQQEQEQQDYDIIKNPLNEINHPILSITDSIQLGSQILERTSKNNQNQVYIEDFNIRYSKKSLQNHAKNDSYLLYNRKSAGYYSQISKGQKQNIYGRKNQEKHSDYIFEDYQCDQCYTQPILNVRFHCKICQDYDLCMKCHETIKNKHRHQFDKIDGLLQRQKARQKLLAVKQTNYKLNELKSKSKRIYH